MGRSDSRTDGAIAAFCCHAIAHLDVEDSPVPEALRKTVPLILTKLRNCDRVFRRHVLITLLEESPKELLMPLVGDLLLTQAEYGTGHRSPRTRRALNSSLASLIARIGSSDSPAPQTMLITFLPDELIECLLPEISAALTDEDEDLRSRAMSMVSTILENHQ